MTRSFNVLFIVLVTFVLSGCSLVDAINDSVHDAIYDEVVVFNETNKEIVVNSYTGADREEKSAKFGERNQHRFLASSGDPYNYYGGEVVIVMVTAKHKVSLEVIDSQTFAVLLPKRLKGAFIVTARLANEHIVLVDSAGACYGGYCDSYGGVYPYGYF